jgi:hypothetical protein
MRKTFLLPVILATQAFALQSPTPASWPLRVETLVSPAPSGSAQPQLSVSGNRHRGRLGARRPDRPRPERVDPCRLERIAGD